MSATNSLKLQATEAINLRAADRVYSYLKAKGPTTMRAGERVQTFWCEECQEWHTDSLLGGDNELSTTSSSQSTAQSTPEA